MLIQSDCRRTITVEEFAALTGVGRNTAYQAARRGELPVPIIKIGRRMVIPRHAVEALLGVALNGIRSEELS